VVAHHGLAARRRVLQRLFQRGDRGLVELGGVLLEHFLHFVVGRGGGVVGGTRIGVRALQRRLDGRGVDGDDFVHVTGAGERLRVAGGLREGLAGGAEAELRELFEVAERQLGEIGKLLDRGLVGGGELVDLEHVWRPCGVGSWENAALHKKAFYAIPEGRQGVAALNYCIATESQGSEKTFAPQPLSRRGGRQP